MRLLGLIGEAILFIVVMIVTRALYFDPIGSLIIAALAVFLTEYFFKGA